MQRLSKKTEGFTDSVIRRMTRIADMYDSINLSQGFPDFAPPEMLMIKKTIDQELNYFLAIAFFAFAAMFSGVRPKCSRRSFG